MNIGDFGAVAFISFISFFMLARVFTRVVYLKAVMKRTIVAKSNMLAYSKSVVVALELFLWAFVSLLPYLVASTFIRAQITFLLWILIFLTAAILGFRANLDNFYIKDTVLEDEHHPVLFYPAAGAWSSALFDVDYISVKLKGESWESKLVRYSTFLAFISFFLVIILIVLPNQF